MNMIKKIGPSGKVALSYIAEHPGVCVLDVDRAVRTARNGHRWMYATVGRLVAAGAVRREWRGTRWALFAAGQTERRMG